MFPAHAGMARVRTSARFPERRVPRACGDGPMLVASRFQASRCSPRMRGWPAELAPQAAGGEVFPAHAGMARPSGLLGRNGDRVPRACGDGPPASERPASNIMCSPRMRGWPGFGHRLRNLCRVFPAHAGMARRHLASAPRDRRVPRACGDGPPAESPSTPSPACSPRMRGWPGGAGQGGRGAGVFPAHAGMARHCGCCARRLERVPRACGDGPYSSHWRVST